MYTEPSSLEPSLVRRDSPQHKSPSSDAVPEALHPGFRHLPMVIDYYATHEPSRIYASIPISDSDLTLGFRDITYAEFANAINHCANWLLAIIGRRKTGEEFETVAYTGPRDIRYPLMTMAIAKLERKVICMSPGATTAAQAHLINTQSARTFLYGEGCQATALAVVKEVATNFGYTMQTAQLPPISALFSEVAAEEVKWNRTWDEARAMPFLVLHTSGTTGLPKPIVYTHQMMASFDHNRLMPDAGVDNPWEHFSGRRCYSPIPGLHLLGMYLTLQFPIISGGIAVFGPADSTSAATNLQVLKAGRCDAFMAPPVYIEELAREPEGLDVLKGFEFVWFAGAPMGRDLATRLAGYTRMEPWMGSTDAGPYFSKNRDEEDWEYYTFREYMGIEFEVIDEEQRLYELVFRKKREFERWQQIFQVFPDIDVYRTGDVWLRHATKTEAWKMVGRTDDLLVLGNGKKMNAADVEMRVRQCPGVDTVIVGGHGRDKPFVLVEWKDTSAPQHMRMAVLWTVIDEVNQDCFESVRMQRDLVMFVRPEKPLPRNVKGGPIKKASERLYAEEIEKMYRKWEERTS